MDTIEALSRNPADTRHYDAVSMREQGMTLAAIAKSLGVSRSTALIWTDAEYAERSRKISRAWKRRQTGLCEECGREVRYAGGHGKRVSTHCVACAGRLNGERRRVWTRELLIERIREWERLTGKPPAIKDWSPWHARVHGDEQRAIRFEQASGHWPWFVVIVRAFGSWNGAIEAAGFTPRPANGSAMRGIPRSQWRGNTEERSS